MNDSEVDQDPSGAMEGFKVQETANKVAPHLSSIGGSPTASGAAPDFLATASLPAGDTNKKENKDDDAKNSSIAVTVETYARVAASAAPVVPVNSLSSVASKRKNGDTALVAPAATADDVIGVKSTSETSITSTGNKKARLLDQVDYLPTVVGAPAGEATSVISNSIMSAKTNPVVENDEANLGKKTKESSNLSLTEQEEDGDEPLQDPRRESQSDRSETANVPDCLLPPSESTKATNVDVDSQQPLSSSSDKSSKKPSDDLVMDVNISKENDDAPAFSGNGFHEQEEDDPSLAEWIKKTNSGSAGNTKRSSRALSMDGDGESQEIVSQYVELPKMKSSRLVPVKPLTKSEKEELETFFEIDNEVDKDRSSSTPVKVTWYTDWLGNIEFADIDISNPDGRASERAIKAPLLAWAQKGGKKSLRGLFNLIRYIYNHKDTPKQAKKILANADPTSAKSLELALRRCCYDPVVLRQDGWKTAKSIQPEGASGRAHRIGEMVFWQGFEGVVIAYTHEADMGDLWKAMWLEDRITFDLEVEELEEGRKKFERRKNRPRPGEKKGSTSSNAAPSEAERRSTRNVSTADFQVSGIEHGIILATSFARGARHGVFWPARVIHASELLGPQSKRINKQKVDVVFLAPYWNSNPAMMMATSRRTESFSDSIARHGDSLFRSGPLFELESIDATDQSIQAYPYDADSGLDIDEIWSSFKFSGLPKAAFARFLDSHRLALALKAYSQRELKSTAASDIDRTSAILLEGHPLSVQTADFPAAVLHLPFDHILSQLPHPEQETSTKSFSDYAENGEPALQLARMLDSMKPPECWGLGGIVATPTKESLMGNLQRNSLTSPQFFLGEFANSSDEMSHDLSRFLDGLPFLQALLSDDTPPSRMLKNNLNEALQGIPGSMEARKTMGISLYKSWIVMKTFGEALISSSTGEKGLLVLRDWRRCCERIFNYMYFEAVSNEEGQSAGSLVLTDSRCNLHLTSSDCFERAVRLPAALKAAREAKGNICISTSVEDKYLELAEKNVILRAHKKSYIQKIKARCMSATGENVVPLTEDSEGNGGEDTKGSKGTWTAAVAAVGAALQGTDMIMTGKYTNVFCPTRPPGHHAGRELHAMKAVSNGFCVLNAVACAAMYATTPISEGGLGLSRVCVIDIDVHHGNGTQDILCSIYDPRFLYVSIHAGGAHVNGVDLGEDSEQIMGHHLGRNLNKKGIFPGRCGDTSPHDGVLNIPLGSRVTSHALGTALVTKVSPAVDRFSPELIIISAGFDAHKNDPLNMGGLDARDFGTLTEVICKLAHKTCSGRVLSILEGGYGVPCCRPQYFTPVDDMTTQSYNVVNSEGEDDNHHKHKDSSKVGAALPASSFDISFVPTNAVKSEAVTALPIRALSATARDQSEGEEGKQGLSTLENAVIPKESDKQEVSQAQSGFENSEVTAIPARNEPKEDSLVPLQCLELGQDLPPDMKDVVASYALQKRLDKCHAEGFLHCVREHVSALARCSGRRYV